MQIAISAGINEVFAYPNPTVGYSYENLGNALVLNSNFDVWYVGREYFEEQIDRLRGVDVLITELTSKEPHRNIVTRGANLSNGPVIIGTQHGSGYEIDDTAFEEKWKWKQILDSCDALIPVSLGNKEYWQLFTSTPVFDVLVSVIPVDRYLSYRQDKYDKFTVMLGDLADMGGDRPLNFMALGITNKLKIHTIGFLRDDYKKKVLPTIHRFGFDKYLECKELVPHFDSMVEQYLSKCHASLMLSRMPSTGRISAASPLVGATCIAGNYYLQPEICPELTLEYIYPSKAIEWLGKLRDSSKYREELIENAVSVIRKKYSPQAICQQMTEVIKKCR